MFVACPSVFQPQRVVQRSTIGVVGRIFGGMAGKPVVLPDAYAGDGNWDEWLDHFGNVAAVNKWTPEQKLLWLKVRLTGRAQRAFKQLSEAAQGDYEEAVKVLRERFEPESKRALYVAEFHTRAKSKSEGWADFGEELRVLADRAFPTLSTDARQLLALQQYLGQIDNPQIAFAVKQRHPTTVEAAVSATLELESYLLPKQRVARVEEASVDRVGGRPDALLETMSAILERLERLETQSSATRRDCQPQSRDPSAPVVCHKCGKEGHYARGCAAKKLPGNGRPSA